VFTVVPPASAAPGRWIVTADVELGDTWLGEAAETLMEVSPT
jgi:hypothetical protein